MENAAERAVLDLLAAGPMEREELLAESGADPSVLLSLRRRGLITSRSRKGREVISRAEPSPWANYLGKVMRTPGSSC